MNRPVVGESRRVVAGQSVPGARGAVRGPQRRRIRRRPWRRWALLLAGLGLLFWWRQRSVPVVPVFDPVPRLGATALTGTTVVIDPGHGGADPGAMHGGVAEAAVTMRMAVVLREVLSAAGARVLSTVDSSEWRRVWTEGEVEPEMSLPRDAVFTWDGSPVVVSDARGNGLYRRSAVAGLAWRSRLPGERVVFLSLHFDAVPGTDVAGSAVCHDRRAPRPALVNALSSWLGRAGLAGGRPSVLSREYAVLNPDKNPVDESVLVELATLTSARDRDRVRDARWRWRAARVLAAAVADGAGNRK